MAYSYRQDRDIAGCQVGMESGRQLLTHPMASDRVARKQYDDEIGCTGRILKC